MKNYLSEDSFDLTKQLIKKMRITCLLLLVFTSSILATNVKSQDTKVSFSIRNAKFIQVLDAIENQTDYLFVYNKNEVDLNREINMEVKNQAVKSVLNGIFQNTGISYAMEGNNIMLMRKIENQQQQKSVSGKVIDLSGSSIPGVSVVIKGTTNGTITDSNGNFSLSGISVNSILQFSFVGMKMQEVAIDGKTTINVTLLEDAIGIEEVVAIGYGTVKKSDLTGSISVVTGDNLTQLASPNFEQGIQGKMAGLQMTQTSAEPGGGISVKIRGNNSLLGSNEPLYVIDGFPIAANNSTRPGGWEGQSSLNLLSNLNPADIESVQVLKDASATSIYGSRGANGVIIITTKGGKAGKGSMNVDYSHSFSSAKSPITPASVYDFARIENERLANTNSAASLYRYTAAPNAFWPAGNASPEQLRDIYGRGTDWVSAVLKPGSTDNINLSFQGGNEKTTYHVSANYYNESGVVIKSDYKKVSVRANIASQVNDKLRVESSFSASRYESDRFSQTGRVLGGGPDRLGTITAAFKANPMATTDTNPLEDNNLLKLTPGSNNVENFIYNPYFETNVTDNSDAMNFVMGTMKIDYDILNGLKMTFNAGANIQNQERVNFYPFSTHVGYEYKGIGSQSFFNRRDYLFENYLNYNKTFGLHTINATVGYSVQKERWQSVNLNGSGYNFDIQGIYGWAQLVSPLPPVESEYAKQTASFYGRFFYNYNSRLMLTLSGRRDGSSVFATNKKWAFFPSAAVAYVLSEESFLKDVSWLSNLKIRLSYGIVGNQAIAPYQSLATLGSQGYAIGGTKVSGLSPATPENPDLIWESTKQLDFGVDASFLNNRIKFSADYYNKRTENLLQNKPVPSITGFTTFTTNFGEVSNKGVELMLGGDILTGKLAWNTNFTWSLNRSKIENLGIAADGTFIKTAMVPSNNMADNRQTHRFVLGQPIGTFYGYTVVGMLQQADIDAGYPTLGALNTPGEFKFKDLNDDKKINDSDLEPLGNAQPDYIFGWDNTLTYGNWSLNVFVNGVIGGEVLNMMSLYTSLGMTGNPSQAYVDDYWSPTNLDAKYPKPGGGTEAMNSFLLEDGSFVRLQSLSLNYKVPTTFLKGTGLSSASIYARGTNLYVWTNYSGFDPETGFSGQASWAANIDLGSYPRPKTVELGVKLSF